MWVHYKHIVVRKMDRIQDTTSRGERQGGERFYNLVVPSDATTDGNRELHELVTGSMFPAIGLVTTTDDVIAHL